MQSQSQQEAQQQRQQLQLLQEQLQRIQQQQQQEQFGLDWRSTLTNEERINIIKRLSDNLKALSPTIADASIVELAKTFEDVTYQRSPNKSEYLTAYNRKLQQIHLITEQQLAVGGSPTVGSPQSQVAMASTPTLIQQSIPQGTAVTPQQQALAIQHMMQQRMFQQQQQQQQQQVQAQAQAQAHAQAQQQAQVQAQQQEQRQQLFRAQLQQLRHQQQQQVPQASTMPGGVHAQTIAAPNQDTTHITAAQGVSNGGLANPGPSGAAPNRMPITNASRIQAAAVVQSMVERIQTNRVPPNLLGDLSQEQKQSVKDQMNQMMPMFMKLDQLMPFFFALTGNREATARLILMKFMFQDQLDSLKHEQYTITPENLVRLKDRLQHYFMWVKSEMAPAPANHPVSLVQAPGSVANVAQSIALGTEPASMINTGLTGLIVSMAGMVLGTEAGSTSTAAFTNAPSELVFNQSNTPASTSINVQSTPPPTQSVPGMDV